MAAAEGRQHGNFGDRFLVDVGQGDGGVDLKLRQKILAREARCGVIFEAPAKFTHILYCQRHTGRVPVAPELGEQAGHHLQRLQ